jgi:adenylate cyclase
MGLEIERKYLVDKQKFRPLSEGTPVHQIYLQRSHEHSIRVRIMGRQAFITIKSAISAMVRNEFEYEIPLLDAQQMFEIFDKMPAVKKIRHTEIFEGNEWVIDVFSGKNDKLLMAEIELSNELENFTKPNWVLEEVTHDPRYHNSNLALNPYNEWSDQKP